MAAFDEGGTITLPRSEEERRHWGWEPHEQVIVKDTYNAADMEFVGNHIAKSGVAQKNSKGALEVTFGTSRLKLLERMIVTWTLTDRAGRPVPVSPLSIARLKANYTDAILSVCDEIAQTLSEEEQEDFLPAVVAPVQAHSSQTSLLPMSS